MKAKKKNKALPIVIMLVAALVLGALYFVLDKLDFNAKPETPSSIITVQSKSLDTITKFTFTDKDERELTFVKEDGLWYIESDRAFPVKSDSVGEMISSMGTILATRELDSDNGEYGFDDPQNVLTVVYAEKDGDVTVKYTVGITSVSGGTYVRDDMSGRIFICSSNPAANFAVAKNDLIELDIFAYTVENTSVNNVTLIGIDGRENSVTDIDGIEAFLGAPFGSIDCADFVEYGADDETMAKYGIKKDEDSPGILLNFKNTQTVTDADGGTSAIRVDATYNVWWGDETEDGEIYYTVTDSTIVYKLSREKYDAVMSYLDYTPDAGTGTDDVTDPADVTETEASESAETTEAAETSDTDTAA